jgi:hypothetical protein
MFRDAKQVPSPWRHCAQNEIYPQPQDEQRPIETRRPTSELRPYILRKVVPNITGGLYTRITRETVVVEDELKLQGAVINGKDDSP